MYKKQINKINKSLEKTQAAIIGLGCSFVQGMGAVNDELYKEYKWESPKQGASLKIKAYKADADKILEKYPSVIRDSGLDLDFTFMEYENSFVNVLCEKYFKGKYTPINFGIRGCGNRATIKELYFYPEIRWDLAKEIIVIYCPSGPERFDFCNDTWQDHFRWKAMWPNYKDMKESGRKKLWEGYAKTLYSDKFEVVEQIAHIQELVTWCKLNNAKLIITPAFDRRYTKKHFKKSLSMVVSRNDYQELISVEEPHTINPIAHHMSLLDLWPWDNMFYPGNNPTFADLMLSQEKDLEDKNDYFFQFINKGSPNGWITPCGHPSAKGHSLFARHLYTHINLLKSRS